MREEMGERRDEEGDTGERRDIREKIRDKLEESG